MFEDLFVIFLFILVVGIVAPFVLPFVAFGAGYAPSGKKKIDTILSIASLQPGEKVADLGSGDGRVVAAFAEHGAEAVGFEINFILVWLSRWLIRKKRLSNASIVKSNFWKQNFSGFDVVVVFGVKYIMPKLEEKLQRELQPGARVVSNYFLFPKWKPAKSTGNIHLYIKP